MIFRFVNKNANVWKFMYFIKTKKSVFGKRRYKGILPSVQTFLM